MNAPDSPQRLERIIRCGEDPTKLPLDEIGAKGYNLLRLHAASRNLGSFRVPRFFIIPDGYHSDSEYWRGVGSLKFYGTEIKDEFGTMKKPVIVRSSSSLEDGIHATFAGMFLSVPGVDDYDRLCTASYRVESSGFGRYIDNYADEMGVTSHGKMAKIVQEQIVNPLFRGVIQLEDDGVTIEGVSLDGKRHNKNVDYPFLADLGDLHFKPHDSLGEMDYYLLAQSALKAKDALGLEGVVQVEFCFSPDRIPDFVQIRQLPKIKSPAQELDMKIPEGVPYIESRVCSGVAGELALPAYVTVSQSGMKSLLISTGQRKYIDLLTGGDMDKLPDKREDIFLKQSNLSKNVDFDEFRGKVPNEALLGDNDIFPFYEQQWESGNSLFPNYVLVCDKLDESVIGMERLTTNKRAIITCMEAMKTSHAMTVARDLGMIAMGVDGEVMDMGFFYNRVETGDLVRIKSDGKRAVAYIEKKRDSDPYAAQVAK